MSQVKPIPDGYHAVQPYLIFEDAAAAIAFYQKAFGATERFRMTGKDGRIGHAEIQIGDSVIMMADQHPEAGIHAPSHYGGSPVSLLIYTADCDGMYNQAVATGGEGFRPPADQPYGDRNAGVKDPFGYRWLIATHIKDVSPEELAALG